jgi:small nuclear ribonucleoprotein (snRNP)-like protein
MSYPEPSRFEQFTRLFLDQAVVLGLDNGGCIKGELHAVDDEFFYLQSAAAISAGYVVDGTVAWAAVPRRIVNVVVRETDD